MHGKLYDSDEKTVQGSSHISRTHGTAPSTDEPPLELSVKKINVDTKSRYFLC